MLVVDGGDTKDYEKRRDQPPETNDDEGREHDDERCTRDVEGFDNPFTPVHVEEIAQLLFPHGYLLSSLASASASCR